MRQRIGLVHELQKNRTLKFTFVEEGIKREGFLAWFNQQPVAYENVCRHIPISLDYGDNRFFSADGQHIICQNHGAMYEPLTGLCVRGPCQGAKLRALEVEQVGDEIWFTCKD
jgi:nitrite reductase/ring-hydroxylating ferredoxin subunit